MSSSEILKKKSFFVNLCYSFKVSITFKILLNSYYQRELEEVTLCEWYQKPMFQNCQFFVVQRLALHQKGVEFRQQSICNIRISPATSQDVVRRRTMLLENWLITDTHTIPCIEAARCLKYPPGVLKWQMMSG